MVSSTGKQDRRGYDTLMTAGITIGVVGILSLFFISWTISLLIVLFGVFVWASAEAVSRPPQNNPADFLRFFRNAPKRRPVLVCVGDSLTHGRVSADFTTMISPKLQDRLKLNPPSEQISSVFIDPLWVVNTGQNSLSSAPVLNERLYYALACYPDYLMLLVGTNDVEAEYSNSKKRSLMRMWGLRQEPGINDFKNNLNKIIEFIRQTSPMTHVGVCTLPPMGEDLTHPGNRLIKQANAIIYDVANQFEKNVSVIPLYEKFEDDLMSKPRTWNNISVNFSTIAATLFVPLHHFFGISYNSLSKIFSNRYLADSLHLNEDGADLVADKVVQWLFANNIHKSIAVKSF